MSDGIAATEGTVPFRGIGRPVSAPDLFRGRTYGGWVYQINRDQGDVLVVRLGTGIGQRPGRFLTVPTEHDGAMARTCQVQSCFSSNARVCACDDNGLHHFFPVLVRLPTHARGKVSALRTGRRAGQLPCPTQQRPAVLQRLATGKAVRRWPWRPVPWSTASSR
jgi:hypothetical protein